MNTEPEFFLSPKDLLLSFPVGYILECEYGGSSSGPLLTFLGANPPSECILVRPGAEPCRLTLSEVPDGFYIRRMGKSGQDALCSRRVLAVRDRHRAFQDIKFLGGFCVDIDQPLQCWAVEFDAHLSDLSVFPFIVDEETERADIAAGDIDSHATWRNRRLSCGIWYPIELQHEDRFAYGVFQIRTFHSGGVCRQASLCILPELE